MTNRMLERPTEDSPDAVPDSRATYEAPGIETVLTPEEIEREVLYAGAITADGLADIE